MQIKGAMNLLSVQRKGRSTFRKRFSNAGIQRYMKIVHILDHWSMEITRKWDGHIYKYNLSLPATEKMAVPLSAVKSSASINLYESKGIIYFSFSKVFHDG